MIKNISFIFLSAISIYFLVSCNDSPTDLGTDFLAQDGVDVLKLDSSIDTIHQSSFSFKNVFPLGGASQLLLGKAENITSHVLLEFVFALPDSIKQELESKSLTILESYVEMNKNYSFGDLNAEFDYAVYKVNEPWSSTTFTADSFAFLEYDNSVDLSFNRSSLNDTVYSFNLDTALTSSWLQDYIDTSIIFNNGILLSPSANTQKVLGFTAFNVSGVNDPRLRIVVQKPGAYIDTLNGFISSDMSIVLGDIPNVGTENIAIQSSLTSEAKLFFDFSVIPEDVVINYAALTLTLDTTTTKTGSSFVNRLSVFLLDDSASNKINFDFLYTLERTGSTFTGEITNIIRAWNNNADNQGILIKSTAELTGLEIYAIKGSNAPIIEQRPRLEIVYSRGKNHQ
ncbi:MAG: hypothetical protein MUF28_09630 [Ignavibacterium sp.]|nr:hypothetical protein [Ignavibacterium sp.]